MTTTYGYSIGKCKFPNGTTKLQTADIVSVGCGKFKGLLFVRWYDNGRIIEGFVKPNLFSIKYLREML